MGAPIPSLTGSASKSRLHGFPELSPHYIQRSGATEPFLPLCGGEGISG